MVYKAQYETVCQKAQIADVKCGAALLSMFEHWTNFKAENWRAELDDRLTATKKQPVSTRLWIYMKQPQMVDELFGLFSENRIRDTLKELENAGFIRRRNNPRKKFDRTLQYLLLVGHVQKAIDSTAQVQRSRYLWLGLSKDQQERLDATRERQRKRCPAGAIPQESLTQESVAQDSLSQKSFHMLLWLSVLKNIRQSQSADHPTTTPATPEEAVEKNAFKLWTEEIGTITPVIKDHIMDMITDFTEAWVMDAVKEARLSKSGSQIGVKYILAILNRWKKEGRETKPVEERQQPHTPQPPSPQTEVDAAAYGTALEMQPVDPPDDFEPDLPLFRRMAEWKPERERRAVEQARLKETVSET